MSLCGTCEFSRHIKDNNQTTRPEYECYVDMPTNSPEQVMGVRKCSMYQEKCQLKELSIQDFKEFPEINPTSLTICANLQTYAQDLDIAPILNKSSLKWIDMMCNQGKALKEFTQDNQNYQYAIGIEPKGERLGEFEYHRIYIGDPATIKIRPKPNLITSRYGFYYADLESKKKYLLSWFKLLENNGKIVIYPYFTKVSHDLDLLDKFIDETFNNIKRKKMKNNLVRLTITKAS